MLTVKTEVTKKLPQSKSHKISTAVRGKKGRRTYNGKIDVRRSISTSNYEVTSSNPNFNCLRMNLELNQNQRSIVASLGNGRLGNQMSNFASCYAIVKEYGMYHYLNEDQLNSLENVFVMPKIVNTDKASYYLWDEGKYNKLNII